MRQISQVLSLANPKAKALDSKPGLESKALALDIFVMLTLKELQTLMTDLKSVSPKQAIANETEERLLSERRIKVTHFFDARPCFGSKLSDLSLDLFKLTYLPKAIAQEIIEENQRSIEEQLASLRFYDLEQNCPTYAGILLFGIKPTWWLPGAYIQFVRFAGTSLIDEVENEQVLSGDLINLLRDLNVLIKLNNQHRPIPKTILQEKTLSAYPTVALRELMINAVMHRWYENSTPPIRFYWFTDHIEIQSPGGLFGEVTPENFPRQTAYRNPVLAEAMKTLGYVNKFGYGVQRAQEALKNNGNPTAKFQLEPTYVVVTVKQVIH